MALDRVDSLEAALRAVPLTELGVYYRVLVAAARKWMQRQMPAIRLVDTAMSHTIWNDEGYNEALADVVRALGLEEPR